jgi:hypothetical protein
MLRMTHRSRSQGDCVALVDAVRNESGIPDGLGHGWHSMRRAFANTLRNVALRDLKDLGGWKTEKAERRCTSNCLRRLSGVGLRRSLRYQVAPKPLALDVNWHKEQAEAENQIGNEMPRLHRKCRRDK